VSRGNRSQTIALLSDGMISDPMIGETIRGSISSALLHEHLLVIAETPGNATGEKRLVDGLLDRGVTGFLYVSTDTRRVRVSAGLRAHPLVLVNCAARARTAPTVIPDEREAGRAVARTLLRHGHTDRIVIVGEQVPTVQAAAERVFGIQQVLAAFGLTAAATIRTAWSPDPAFAAVGGYLAGGPRPSALICLNDRIALGAYQACRDVGLAVPEDISVISFDDSDLALWLQPQLSSVAVPHGELGRRAVELLLCEPRPPEVHLVPTTLRERASIGAPSRRRPSNRVRSAAAGPVRQDKPAASVGRCGPILTSSGQPMVAVTSGVVTPLPLIE
jgi:LacI family transcriptional regulator